MTFSIRTDNMTVQMSKAYFVGEKEEDGFVSARVSFEHHALIWLQGRRFPRCQRWLLCVKGCVKVELSEHRS